MQVLHEKYENDPDVVILALDVGDDNEKMAKYWKEHKCTFPTLNDADDVAKKYGIKAFPSAVLVGADGKVLAARVGSVHTMEDELEKALADLKARKKEAPAAPERK